MNLNIKLSITDQERDHIKNLIDSKISKKLATRSEISDLVNMFITQLIESELKEPRAIAKQVVGSMDGFKFKVEGNDVELDEFLDFTCSDCGCMASVSETRLKQLPEDKTGLGQYWFDALPQEIS